MRLLKLLALGLVLVLVTGCACRKKVSSDNVPLAEPGRELGDINYAFDSYALDARAKSILERNADWLSNNADRKVQIEGHCDERGTKEYNMVLGMNRARAAMEYLRSLGISRERMSTVSYGEELPLDPGRNEEAWAKNRRAHFNIE